MLPGESQEVPCPLCGTHNWREYTWAPSHYGPERFRVTKCRDCGMIATNPQSTGYANTIEQRGVLNRHFAEANLARLRRVGRLMLTLLEPLTTGRRVLDFGCGEGSLVYEARRSGWDALGCDLNRGLVEAANQHWGFNALSAGSLDEFIASNTALFDAIVSSQVFEHLQQPVAVGLRLVSLLKPGGVLLIDVPNARQLKERFRRGDTLDPTSHWSHFTLETLQGLFTRIGCVVVYASAAPSLVNLYHRLGLTTACYPLARLTKRVLPAIGTGACVIGRRRTGVIIGEAVEIKETSGSAGHH